MFRPIVVTPNNFNSLNTATSLLFSNLLPRGKQLSSLGTVFAYLTCSNFREFKLFTGITSIGNEAFRGIKTGVLIIPPTLTSAYGPNVNTSFIREATIGKMIISEGADLGNGNRSFYNQECRVWVLGNSCTQLWNIHHAASNNIYPERIVIIDADTVKPIQVQSYYNSSRSRFDVYVPDELVNSYKADETWQANFNLNKIHPISEYTGTIWE